MRNASPCTATASARRWRYTRPVSSRASPLASPRAAGATASRSSASSTNRLRRGRSSRRCSPKAASGRAAAMMEGTRAAIDKARKSGIGLALVKATTHTGALGYYTQSAAREGCAAIALAASIPLMAYHGTRAAAVGTAPLSIAVPGGDEPFALDMASSLISMGALMRARATGAPIPEDAALAADGSRTTDSRKAAIPLPLGGPKGAGLAFMVECLASLLTGNPILAEALAGRGRHKQNGLVIAIDVARFMPLADFTREVQRLAAALRRLPADGEILMPGERGARNAARHREALEIDADVYAELSALN